MGNRCCGWCARVCCCCCCCCCREDQPLLKSPRRPSEEQPILTVVQDPTGNSETQEMKFNLHSDNISEDWEPPRGGVGGTKGKDSAPTSPQHKPLVSSQSPEEATSPSRTFVRGGTGKTSWRLTPTPTPAGGRDGGRETGTATVTFPESHTMPEETPDFVLMSQELEGAELGEMQVSKSFTISFQGITEN